MSRAAITNLDARSFSTLFCGLRCKLSKPPLCTLSAVFMACLTAVLSPLTGLAQNRCNNGVQLEGIVTDATGAMIPGAQVLTSDGERAIADGTGHYVLPCVSAGHVSVTVRATGFDAKVVGIATHAGQVAHVNVQLAVATVENKCAGEWEFERHRRRSRYGYDCFRNTRPTAAFRRPGRFSAAASNTRSQWRR